MKLIEPWLVKVVWKPAFVMFPSISNVPESESMMVVATASVIPPVQVLLPERLRNAPLLVTPAPSSVSNSPATVMPPCNCNCAPLATVVPPPEPTPPRAKPF